ncbi:acyltransferase family protein [Paraburkholderia xenovorans]
MRNQSLEGLRGVAAVMVIFSHLVLTFWPNMAVNIIAAPHGPFQEFIFNSPLTFLFSGNLAVCIFFVLSGYVLTAKFWRTEDMSVIWTLAARRYFRLMPPVLLSLLIGYAMLKAGLILAHEKDAPTWISWTYSLTPVLQTAVYDGLFRAFLSDKAYVYNPVTWTMRYEFLGSLLTFSFCALCVGFKRRWILYIAVICVLMFTVPAGIYYALFIAGIWLADISLRKTPAPIALGVLLIAAWLGGATPGSTSHADLEILSVSLNGYPTDFVHVANAIASILIVWVVLTSDLMAAFFAFFHELGRRSFSIYLIHFPILASVGLFVFRKTYAHFPLHHSLSAAVACAVTLVASYVASGLYATWIDGMSIRLSHLGSRLFLGASRDKNTSVDGLFPSAPPNSPR